MNKNRTKNSNTAYVHVHVCKLFFYRTLRTFSSRPKGCIKLRELSRIVPALQDALTSCPDNDDMIREVGNKNMSLSAKTSSWVELVAPTIDFLLA